MIIMFKVLNSWEVESGPSFDTEDEAQSNALALLANRKLSAEPVYVVQILSGQRNKFPTPNVETFTPVPRDKTLRVGNQTDKCEATPRDY